jgi:hypothetical protein
VSLQDPTLTSTPVGHHSGVNWWLWLLVLAAVAVAGGLLWWWRRPSSTPEIEQDPT